MTMLALRVVLVFGTVLCGLAMTDMAEAPRISALLAGLAARP
jgi:hypothetical protein